MLVSLGLSLLQLAGGKLTEKVPNGGIEFFVAHEPDIDTTSDYEKVCKKTGGDLAVIDELPKQRTATKLLKKTGVSAWPRKIITFN